MGFDFGKDMLKAYEHGFGDALNELYDKIANSEDSITITDTSYSSGRVHEQNLILNMIADMLKRGRGGDG